MENDNMKNMNPVGTEDNNVPTYNNFYGTQNDTSASSDNGASTAPNGTPAPKAPKKKWPVAVAGTAAAVVLGGGAVFAFTDAGDFITNKFLSAIQSPAEYYRTVEKNALSSTLEEAFTNYDSSLETLKADSFGANVSISYAPSADALSYIKPITEQIDFNLDSFKSLGFITESYYSENGMDVKVGATINNESLISAVASMDLANKKMFMQIPELNDAYIDLSPIIESSPESIQMPDLKKIIDIYPDKKDLTDFITKYSDIIIDTVNNVERKDGQITATNVSEDCTVLDVKISEKDFANMCLNVLDASKDEKLVKDFIDNFSKYAESLGVSMPDDDFNFENYQAAISEGKSELEEAAKDASNDKILIAMTVYVNSVGEIIGRDVSINSDDNSLTFTNRMAVSSGKYGYELKLDLTEDGSHKNIVSLVGSGDYDLAKFSGDFVVTSDITPYKLIAKLSDCNTINMLKGEFSGKIELSTDYSALADSKLIIVADVKKNSFSTDISASYSGIDLGTISLNTSQTKEHKSFAPGNDDKVVGFEEADQLFANFNLGDFLKSLEGKTGIKISENTLSALMEYASSALSGNSLFSDDDVYEYDDDYNFSDYSDDYSNDDYNLDDYDYSDEEDYSDDNYSDYDLSDLLDGDDYSFDDIEDSNYDDSVDNTLDLDFMDDEA